MTLIKRTLDRMFEWFSSPISLFALGMWGVGISQIIDGYVLGLYSHSKGTTVLYAVVMLFVVALVLSLIEWHLDKSII